MHMYSLHIHTAHSHSLRWIYNTYILLLCAIMSKCNGSTLFPKSHFLVLRIDFYEFDAGTGLFYRKKTINNPIIYPISRRELHRDSKVMGEIVWVGKWRSKVVVNCVQMFVKHETVRFFLSLNF